MSLLDAFNLNRLICILTLLVCVVLTIGASEAQPEHAKAAAFFDIDAQPLGAALSQFGDQSGHEVLYDTRVAIGKSSRAVRGMLLPSDALMSMLAGTDLTAKYISGNVFILLAAPQTGRGIYSDMPVSHRAYYGLIQRTLLDVLCRSPETQPGRYRVVLLLWLRGDGGIDHLQRLGSIGSHAADQHADAAIGAVRFVEPPPPDFAQPVLLVILPQASGRTPGCAGELSLTDPRLR
jgi:hypothetical protein